MIEKGMEQMRAFDKPENITKQARKKYYPKYIAYIDYRAGNKAPLLIKAMVETNLLSAMKTLETAANERIRDIYLVSIYKKQAETTDIGEPLYKMVIGARIGEYGPIQWHFWDKEHNETPHGLYRWYGKDFTWSPSCTFENNISKWDCNGHLEYERCE